MQLTKIEENKWLPVGPGSSVGYVIFELVKFKMLMMHKNNMSK